MNVISRNEVSIYELLFLADLNEMIVNFVVCFDCVRSVVVGIMTFFDTC